jgi:exosortase A-associated hydrolase 2
MIRSEAMFLPFDPGQRLCIVHTPATGNVRAVVICVAPFAEEMNKSRRMLAVTARAFAQAGFAVVLIDLLGCGDSSGDFGDADWSIWLRDIAATRRWAAGRYAAAQWLWGVRGGALLAAESATEHGECGLMLWQPVLSGQQHLGQFLRLRIAADALNQSENRESTKQIRDRLRRGHREEIAGYTLAPALADGLEGATLALPSTFRGKIIWCEVSPEEPAALGPASEARVAEWREAGLDIRALAVCGPAFWQTPEITECPGLVQVSLDQLLGGLS